MDRRWAAPPGSPVPSRAHPVPKAIEAEMSTEQLTNTEYWSVYFYSTLSTCLVLETSARLYSIFALGPVQWAFVLVSHCCSANTTSDSVSDGGVTVTQNTRQPADQRHSGLLYLVHLWGSDQCSSHTAVCDPHLVLYPDIEHHLSQIWQRFFWSSPVHTFTLGVVTVYVCIPLLVSRMWPTNSHQSWRIIWLCCSSASWFTNQIIEINPYLPRYLI